MVSAAEVLAGMKADPATAPLPTVAARPMRATVAPRPAPDTARLAIDMQREADIVVVRVWKCRHRAARAAKDLTLQRGDVSCRRVPKAWISLRLWGQPHVDGKTVTHFGKKRRETGQLS